VVPAELFVTARGLAFGDKDRREFRAISNDRCEEGERHLHITIYEPVHCFGASLGDCSFDTISNR
jgi:hypothetical protein